MCRHGGWDLSLSERDSAILKIARDRGLLADPRAEELAAREREPGVEIDILLEKEGVISAEQRAELARELASAHPAEAARGGAPEKQVASPVAEAAPKANPEASREALSLGASLVAAGAAMEAPAAEPAPPPPASVHPSEARPPAEGICPAEPAPDLDRRLAELETAATGDRSGKRIDAATIRKEGADFRGFEFGPYAILGEIARGGMGVLFRARQANVVPGDPASKLPSDVALKVVMTRTGTAAAAADIERFIREIRVLITLQHPNIVRIWDAGKENGLHYYTMELIDGRSLKDCVREGPMPLVMSLAIVREIALALGAMHEAGMLHRDVKPANILMDRALSPYRPVLIDFGLIKGLGRGDPKLLGKLTGGAGEVAGTPAYMAPEATDAGGGRGDLGPASDLYSLGAVLYFLITRRSPFQGSRAEDVIRDVQTTPPKPPSRIVEGVPDRVEAIVLRCLEKRPEQRFASMRELARELDREVRGARRAIWRENAFLRARRRLFG